MAELRCAECGERLTRGRARGTLTHVARVVAACDLNADHPPVPDLAALGEPACRVCGGPVTWSDGRFVHAGPGGADHDADPDLPY